MPYKVLMLGDQRTFADFERVFTEQARLYKVEPNETQFTHCASRGAAERALTEHPDLSAVLLTQQVLSDDGELISSVDFVSKARRLGCPIIAIIPLGQRTDQALLKAGCTYQETRTGAAEALALEISRLAKRHRR